MMAGEEHSKNLAGISVAYSISIIVTMICLAIFFSGIQVFGPLSDLLGGVSAIILLGVIWLLHKRINPGQSLLAILLLMLAVLGTMFLVYGSVQVATGEQDWRLGGVWVSQGYGLMGVWFIANMAKVGKMLDLRRPLVYLGYASALSLIIGLFGLLPLLSLVSRYSVLTDVVIASTGTTWLLTASWTFLLSLFIQKRGI